MPMDLQFDFRLHVDRSTMSGTQYFELLPGRYAGRHWNQQSRFIHEYTFCLVEGIFQKHVPAYDHWGLVEVSRPAWEVILRDLASVRAGLEDRARSAPAPLPYGTVLRVQASFEEALDTNERALAKLIAEMDQWLRQVLRTQEIISILGL